VSVSGTGSDASTPAPLFLGSVASGELPHRLSEYGVTDLPATPSYYLRPAFHSRLSLASCVTTLAPHRWRGNVDPLPIGYAFRPHLRVPANWRMIYIAAKTLGFRRTGFSPVFAATHARILTSLQSTPPYGETSAHRERSPTARLREPAASVPGLSPAKFSAHGRSAGQLLRTV
jgi:hypothetical protein